MAIESFSNACESIQACASFADYFGISLGVALLAIILIATWTTVWKALGLWKSARKKHLAWFIIFVVLNGLTIGILEILYIYVFSKMGRTGKPKEPKPKKK
ncbi:MAG: DUF5652 family protein [Nanoarchaeota archaeon]